MSHTNEIATTNDLLKLIFEEMCTTQLGFAQLKDKKCVTEVFQ
jgi:hypothetical protein